ncbi:MAG: hypothetical protein PUD72_00375 [Oscillospiraceae bacterium]|nr:hypothetical protein [Oscillospiraceae bacterium]
MVLISGILFISIVVGITLKNREMKKLLIIKDFTNLLLEIKRQINLFLLPIPLIINKVNRENYKYISSFIESLENNLNLGENFESSWIKSIDEFNSNSNLLNSSLLYDLKVFGEQFGMNNCYEEIQMIDSLITRLDDLYDEQKNNFDLSSKVKMMLPIYLGAIVCVFIL